MDDSRIKDVSSLLRAFFDEEQLRQGGQYARFFSSWKAIVGERAAGHSRIADVERGNLVVEADHPGWIQMLQLRQSSILDSVRQRFPELDLRGIVFRLSRDFGTKPAGPAPRIGPFGPGGRALESGEESPRPGQERSAGDSADASAAGSVGGSTGPAGTAVPPTRKTPRLDDIGDPLLKARLEELKKAIEEGKKDS